VDRGKRKNWYDLWTSRTSGEEDKKQKRKFLKRKEISRWRYLREIIIKKRLQPAGDKETEAKWTIR